MFKCMPGLGWSLNLWFLYILYYYASSGANNRYMLQVRLGPLWTTLHNGYLTMWWSHKVRIFHGTLWVHPQHT